MSRIKKKFIRLGTGADELNSRDIPANFTPSSYTPTAVGSEGTNKVSSHLNGIDSTLGSLGATTGDIGLTTFSASNNQNSAADVTGFVFSNATVRSFKALVSVAIIATSSLFEEIEIHGIQKVGSWEISVSKLGDESNIIFSITNLGQIQYTSSNISGFVSNKISFRAWVTQV